CQLRPYPQRGDRGIEAVQDVCLHSGRMLGRREQVPVGQRDRRRLGGGGADVHTGRDDRHDGEGTTTVPVALTASSGSARTSAAEADRSGRPRQTTRHSKASVRLRLPTRVTVAEISSTSPARIGARNWTSLYEAKRPSSPSVRMQTSVATSPKSPSAYAPST